MKIGKLVLGIVLSVSPVSQDVLAGQTGQAAAAREKSATDQWREDLRFMAEEMPKYHRNLFHTTTREQFESAVQRLDERIPSLTRHQIIVVVTVIRPVAMPAQHMQAEFEARQGELSEAA